MLTKEMLKTLRTKRGLTGKQVADGIGIAYNVYQTYESGVRNAGLPVVEKLADFYGVTTDYLLGRTDPIDPLKGMGVEVRDISDERFIATYEKLPAEAKQFFVAVMRKLVDAATENEKQDVQEIQEKIEQELVKIVFHTYPRVSAGTGNWADSYTTSIHAQIPENDRTKGTTYCCYVSGDSMSPDYNDGDIVCVNEQICVEKGQIGIFCVDGDLYIKELGDGELISRNPLYDNIKITPDTYCEGLVLCKIDESDIDEIDETEHE